MLKDKLLQLINKVKDDFQPGMSAEDFWTLEKKYLGRKGELAKIMKNLKELATEEKKEIGLLANNVKNELESFFSEQKKTWSDDNVDESSEVDLTLPGEKTQQGHLHPITKVQQELEDIFISLGFIVEDGPELESEYYNFDALNIPFYHPARDIQDTFFTEEGNLLRTHTSPIQIRAMEKYGAPLKLIAPGVVYRYEASDASHNSAFHQIEGLMIDKEISIANLIAISKEFLSLIFKKEVEIRLRPGFFPFVEPGFEMDLKCLLCNGKGCSACKQSGYIEFMGCGLVHPNVLKAGGIDPKEYSGFAFGFGLDRLIMMRYGIEDIRHLLSGDIRFLKQF